MEHITSRKNNTVRHLRELGRDASYRRERGQFLCDGHKLLREAVQFGAKVRQVLWKEKPLFDLPGNIEQFTSPADLFDYVSPMKNSPGPVFSLELPEKQAALPGKRVIVLENVQDPGNVGTVVRTANALGYDAVILVGDCADLYNPKTARATMGAIFRQCVVSADIGELKSLLETQDLELYGAALTDEAKDIRQVALDRCAVCIGSEGRGLSGEMLSACDGQLIIPMRPDSESFNAAVAASIVMWETVR